MHIELSHTPGHGSLNAPPPIRALGWLVDWSVVAVGAAMIVLVFVNVLFHLLGKDIAWTTELCELLMVWVTFLGGASAAERGAHMTITEFVDKLDPPRRRWADLTIQTVCLVVLGLLIKFGYGIVASSWDNTLTVLNVPMAVQYLAMPLGATAMFVFISFDAWRTFRGVPRDHRYPAA